MALKGGDCPEICCGLAKRQRPARAASYETGWAWNRSGWSSPRSNRPWMAAWGAWFSISNVMRTAGRLRAGDCRGAVLSDRASSPHRAWDEGARCHLPRDHGSGMIPPAEGQRFLEAWYPTGWPRCPKEGGDD